VKVPGIEGGPGELPGAISVDASTNHNVSTAHCGPVIVVMLASLRAGGWTACPAPVADFIGIGTRQRTSIRISDQCQGIAQDGVFVKVVGLELLIGQQVLRPEQCPGLRVIRECDKGLG
jgi:hypothetical protein